MPTSIVCIDRVADLSPRSYIVATEFLSGLDKDWARLIAAVGPCTHRTRSVSEPYEALIRSVASQQLHASASQAILARFLALYPDAAFPSAQQLLETNLTQIRSCGFSLAKANSIVGIARAAYEGNIPTREQALLLSNQELISRLVTLPGVGPWTVEMFLIFSLGRSDILPVGDFAVREGYRQLKGLDKAPTPKQLQELGQAWGPYRTVATWYLWQRPGSSREKSVINYTVAQCSLGTVLIALGQRGICWVSLGDNEDVLWRELKEFYSNKELLSSDKQLDIIKDKIIEQIENPTTKGLDLPLNLVGTVFQKQVWHALMKIPKGKTATYSEIAARLGSPKAARAVASACASNRLAVLVPCHRVVRQDGQLSGYRWGVERKRELLRREKICNTVY